MRNIACLGLICLQLFTAAMSICAEPNSHNNIAFSATYLGKHSRISIKTIRTLSLSDSDTFSLTSKAKSVFGSISESSVFTLDKHKIMPLNYYYKRRIFGISKKEAIAFDWDRGKAEYTRNKKASKRFSHVIRPGYLDPSLYQLDLQRDLYNKKETFEYHYVKREQIKSISFKKSGELSYSLNGKDYPAIRLERTNPKPSEHTLVTVIPELYFQIARINHLEKGGDRYEISLVDFEANTELIKKIYSKKRPINETQTE